MLWGVLLKEEVNSLFEGQPPMEQPTDTTHLNSLNKAPIRVLIADANLAFRQQCKHFLLQHRVFRLVGECRDGNDVPLLCRASKPDVVIIDLHLPRMNGVEVTYCISQMFSRIQVLVLAEQADRYGLETIRSGAAGYLLKSVSMEQLFEAVQVIAQGGYYIHPVMIGPLIDELRRLSQQEGVFQRIHREQQIAHWQEILTYREMDVLRLMAQGKNNRTIGEHLNISEKTVKNHVSNILYKLNVQDRTQAVLAAIRYGWVQFM